MVELFAAVLDVPQRDGVRVTSSANVCQRTYCHGEHADTGSAACTDPSDSPDPGCGATGHVARLAAR